MTGIRRVGRGWTDVDRGQGPGPTEYAVRPGDTLARIARRLGVSPEALLRANPQIRDPDRIFPGQALRIPDGQGPSPAVTSPASLRDTYERAPGPGLFGTRPLPPAVGGLRDPFMPPYVPVTMDSMDATLKAVGAEPLRERIGGEVVLAALNETMKRLGLATPEEKAMFIAQVLYECNYLRTLEEYASGWSYDPSVKPKKAKKLGNTQPGDGPRFKGRGFIQLTGRSNYQAFTEWLHQYVLRRCPQDKAGLESRIRQELEDIVRDFNKRASDLRESISKTQYEIAKIEARLKDPGLSDAEKKLLYHRLQQLRAHLKGLKWRLDQVERDRHRAEKGLTWVTDLDLAKADFTQEPYNELIGLSPTLAGLATQYFWEANILGRPWAGDPRRVSRAVNRGDPYTDKPALDEDKRLLLYKKSLEVLKRAS